MNLIVKKTKNVRNIEDRIYKKLKEEVRIERVTLVRFTYWRRKESVFAWIVKRQELRSIGCICTCVHLPETRTYVIGIATSEQRFSLATINDRANVHFRTLPPCDKWDSWARPSPRKLSPNFNKNNENIRYRFT